uniref:Uncharacterized protein n=1 Tax=Arundo donax TaxID=35708 RepID=A0A0A8YNG6_ARUDO
MFIKPRYMILLKLQWSIIPTLIP